ncbi:JAB domain-containing protein [Daejeonella sp. JGW-45]|uniref:JAB domain-containing protein n=1 Tax=Daejeonella sp. JGW-45 TaxID=3034148 RepID=UPI0023EADC32|nr:JAB domain-containing protein [Daejeonella sp. JGW-45]
MKQNQIASFPVQELQLVYKQKFNPSDRPKITTSEEAYRVLLSTWNLGTIGFIEEFKILLLNRANRVIGCYEVSSGGLCGTIADPRVIFAVALKCCAVGLILAHNHPSGNLVPSNSDLELTSKLKMAGKLLDIIILDHIILSNDFYFSFADEGIT